MHRIPVCSALLRHCRSSAAAALHVTPTFQQIHSASPHNTGFKGKMVLSAKERRKLILILKCPEQQSKLAELCGERETKYAMSDNGRELHLTSKTSQHHLPVVEKRIRQMLAELQTYQFKIPHPARALLELDNLINIRALLEYGQEWVEVEPRGRSLNDDYIFTATGKPEALTSFKRKLHNKLNCIRSFEMPLPEFVPLYQDLLEVVKEINQRPSTVCFVENRVVRCWNFDKEALSEIKESVHAVLDSWKVESEERWVGSEVLAKYIQVYLDSEQRSPVTRKVKVSDLLHNYDDSCVTLKLKGLKYPVQKLSSEIGRTAREAALIKIPVPAEVLNSLASSQFKSYWSSYTTEMLILIPTEAQPSLTLVGPADSVNHRLLYFYRILRATHPAEFSFVKPSVVYKYNAASQFEYDQRGVIRDLVEKFPNATFTTDSTQNTDPSHPLHLYVSGDLEDLQDINSVLKAHVPVVITRSFPDVGKIFKVLKENDLVNSEVESVDYAGGIMLKAPEPLYARQARDTILEVLDKGQRYRLVKIQTGGVSDIILTERMINEIEEYAKRIGMPISILTYELKSTLKSCIYAIEGVGDFGQFLKIRNFCKQQFNMDSYRELAWTSSNDDITKNKRRWLQNCYEELFKVFESPISLYKQNNQWCIGGREEHLDEAREMVQTALDGLVYRTIDISRISGDVDVSDLKSRWPMVYFWTSQSKHRTNLKIIGKMESVQRILRELRLPVSEGTLEIPLHERGFPFLNYLGKKLFLPDGVPSNSWPSKFPEANCTLKVNKTPYWSITLEGEAEEMEKARRRLNEAMKNIHYREVVLDDGIFDVPLERKGGLTQLRDSLMSKIMSHDIHDSNTQDLNHRETATKLKRLRNALQYFDILKRCINDDEVEVSASVGINVDSLTFSVIGDDPDKVEIAANKLQDLCQDFLVQELKMTGKQHLISHKYIEDLMSPHVNRLDKSRPFNVEYYINRKDNIITVFGTSEEVKLCFDKIGDILSNTSDVTLDVSDKLRGQYLGELIRLNYFKYTFPAARLFYNSYTKSLNIYGPSSEVEQLQKYLEDVVHETYKIEYHYSNFVTLSRRLKHLATGVLIVEGPDRTVNLMGSKENVQSVVKMLDFIMGKRKPCHLNLAINNRKERVHLGTVTNLVTKSNSDKFPNVTWYLLGDQLCFSGPELQAEQALQYSRDKYYKRVKRGEGDTKKIVSGGE